MDQLQDAIVFRRMIDESHIIMEELLKKAVKCEVIETSEAGLQNDVDVDTSEQIQEVKDEKESK